MRDADTGEGAGFEPPRSVEESESRALLAAVVASSEDAILSKTLGGIVTSWNASAERIFGYSAAEMIGRSILTIIPEDRHSEETEIISKIRAGERVAHFDTLRRRKDGQLVPISLTVSPVRASDGRIIGASKIARDISDRKRLEAAQRALVSEVNHRSKNLLATVQSIIRHTASTGNADEFARRITERLRALSANQDLLVASGWRGIPLGSLVSAQLHRLADLPAERVLSSGVELELAPAAAQAIGLAIHELATNARAFGALSNSKGRVTVTWQVEDGESGPELVVRWSESGGPRVSAPTHDGFGTTILQRLTSHTVGGRVSLSYRASGLVWQLRAPMDRLLAPVTAIRPLTDVGAGR